MRNTLARETLKKHFGYEHFRPMQEEIISTILEGKDVLVLMPTGGGKSICYQVPAIAMKGTAVIISPLISLMKDQVEGLLANGIKAAFLNSSQPTKEQHRIENIMHAGQLDLLYLSPEKLLSPNFISLLKTCQINLFAIDEAHCISAWGHDFRQEYTKLKVLKKEFPDIPVTAFTATADRLTRQDIIKQLQMQTPEVFVASFDRPNLSIEVRSGQKKMEQITRFIRQKPDQSGIIYCLSRKSTERVAESLQDKGINASFYHAGMSSKERMQIQEAFVKDEVQIIAATIAFGMGIDKSNVRWIIHYNLPKNLEGYYQEIGRAGRDGLPADTLLFYSIADYNMLEDIIRNNESNNLDIQLSKLDRMRQFAEALSCRRRLLLNYFSENQDKDCGNCDVCQNPPQYFDGTTIAQMALSAIYRLRQKVGLGTLIDVLKGSKKQEVLKQGYNKIKTFGVGKEISAPAWQYYLLQMINLGLLEIFPTQKRTVRLTPLSQQVLFQHKKIRLVQFKDYQKRKTDQFDASRKLSVKEKFQKDLFNRLRILRRKLAQKEGLPPYIIFNDASLKMMAEQYPLTADQFLNISGVTENKLEKYGDIFIDEILSFVQQHPKIFKGSSSIVSKILLHQGLSVEEIAARRKASPATIYAHLTRLYEQGDLLDISQFVDETEKKQIAKVLDIFSPPYKLKEVYEHLNEEIEYHKIRFVIAERNRQNNKSHL